MVFKGIEKLCQFTGRAHQAEYWYFFLFNFLISLGLGIVDGVAGTLASNGQGLIGGIYSLAVFIPSIAVGARRLHDVGKSGWFLLIPFYNLYLLCLKGEGKNQYGDNPLDPEGDMSDHLID